mmetsp:Transcript_15416/g.32267  ORF Transcript_15416/g.32267 Transcript_15416/m.32267 type:complete len:114 (-) Transcript_15416:725-1066(-)
MHAMYCLAIVMQFQTQQAHSSFIHHKYDSVSRMHPIFHNKQWPDQNILSPSQHSLGFCKTKRASPMRDLPREQTCVDGQIRSKRDTFSQLRLNPLSKKAIRLPGAITYFQNST